LSKLFDQLKDAARSREGQSPGLLANALQRQKAGQDASGTTPVEAASAPESPAASGGTTPSRITSYSGIGLAVLIFAVAVFAWHSAPFRAPQKLRIDPSGLKLDRSLDLDRTTPKGTSPPGRPS
jgi:hypothetical protein